MQIVDVIPLSRGIGKETLSYYTARPVATGSIVSVPVRARVVPALVVGIRDARALKSDVRSASYGLKKVRHIHRGSLFLPAFMDAAKDAAAYFAATTGAVLESLTPRAILTDTQTTTRNTQPDSAALASKTDTLVPVKALVQAPEQERVATYKSLIREEFARGHSVFLCMPTVHTAESLLESLGRGIEEYTYTLHSELSKKEQLARWKQALADEHPILIIATGTFLAIPRTDIKTIIIENESAGTYKAQRRPYVDIRTFAEYLARATGAKLICGDFPLRTETLYRRDNGEFSDVTPLKFRALTQANVRIVDMAGAKNSAGEKTAFSLLSPELTELIHTSVESSERLFILAARRGLYPVTVCNDCGHVVLCARCIAPVILHRNTSEQSRDENVFICHSCGTRYESEDRCGNCGGWRLAPLGIGIERVAEMVAEAAPNARVFRIDRDTTPTRAKVCDTAQRFNAAPGSILLGTQMALPYISDIPNIAVASLDALLARADFRMHEKIFRFLLQARDTAAKNLLIQTRMAYMPIFPAVLQGNILDFYRAELAQRKKFGYPPFKVLITCSVQGNRRVVEQALSHIRNTLKDHTPDPLPMRHTEDRKMRGSILFRVPPETWPDNSLAEKLAALPPSVAVTVEPEEM